MSYPPREVQRQLAARGYYKGKIDGIVGPKTKAAIVAFKTANGLKATDYVGPITWELLTTRAVPAGTPLNEPEWLFYARRLIGVSEVKGSRHNAKIIAMWQTIRAPFRDDETPWCAGMVGHCLEKAGYRSTRRANARSYCDWGRQIKTPCVGAVVVFWRGSPNGWQGHVGFVVGRDQRGRLLVLGGNQSDAVNIQPFSQKRVVGFYLPADYDGAEYSLPRYTSTAAASTNEA